MNCPLMAGAGIAMIFYPVSDALVYINDFGTFHDCTIRTGLHTFATVNTFVLVNVFGAVFSFRDCFYRASFFAWNGGVDDSVIRADFRT